MRPILWALLLTIPLLAGCADNGGDAGAGDGAIEGKVDEGGFQLAEGKGAISGLLVDDRFRPIDLTDDPTSEFQFKGFILLQETGQQVQSNENGEFSFVDLEPGQYTLRATIDKHEVTPVKVQVQAGEFAEATLQARRVLSEGGSTVTMEYSGFVPCATGGAVRSTVGCTFDESGDSYRPGPGLNLTGQSELYYMVIEAVTNQAGGYELVWREDDGTNLGGTEYGRDAADDYNNPYMRLVLANSQNVQITEDLNASGIDNWPNDWSPMDALVFYTGEEPVAEVPIPGSPVTNEGSFPIESGARTAIEIDYLITLFLGEPEGDIDLTTYCVYCEGILGDG